MALEPADRAKLIALLPTLAPGADAAEAVRWFLDHRADALDELGAVPGLDPVRAGVLRLLPAAVPGLDERAALLKAAETALQAGADGEASETAALRRHPAWTAIGWLELVGQRDGDALAGLPGALALARKGFAGPGEVTGDGEVLWAIAEVAGDVGWHDLADPLLDAAARAPFAEPENRGRVRLLQVLRLIEVDPERAAPAIEVLLAMSPLDDRTHVHALCLAAQADAEAQRIERAVTRFEAALELLDDDDDAEVREVVLSALTALGARSSDPAQA